MEIFSVVNNHRESNTYILRVSDKKVVLIDVGDFDLICFEKWLKKRKCSIEAVILTHEHSDHCMGLNKLSELYNFDLYCSEACAQSIKDPKQNFSKYLEGIEAFSIDKKCFVIKDYDILTFGSEKFTFLETPGHSPGSICIFSKNFLFSGDTFMNTKTPLSFPHSDKSAYAESLKKLSPFLNKKTIVFPGHGNSFAYNEK